MDYDNIKRLIDDMGCSKLTSLEIDFPDGTKISMKKDGIENSSIINKKESCVKKEFYNIPENNTTIENTSVATENNIGENVDNPINNEVYKYIKSPMVGTFYSKPSPTDNCFIEVGDNIKKGTTTCIIEAMKLMNEIETEFDGEVVEVLKKDGDPVEYGENLIKLK